MTPFKIGQAVYDRPSGLMTTVVEIEHVAGWTSPGYRVADNVPIDPTGDGAFGDRWRNDFELLAEAPNGKDDFDY